jgi:hypothetical protein
MTLTINLRQLGWSNLSEFRQHWIAVDVYSVKGVQFIDESHIIFFLSTDDYQHIFVARVDMPQRRITILTAQAIQTRLPAPMCLSNHNGSYVICNKDMARMIARQFTLVNGELIVGEAFSGNDTPYGYIRFYVTHFDGQGIVGFGEPPNRSNGILDHSALLMFNLRKRDFEKKVLCEWNEEFRLQSV